MKMCIFVRVQQHTDTTQKTEPCRMRRNTMRLFSPGLKFEGEKYVFVCFLLHQLRTSECGECLQHAVWISSIVSIFQSVWMYN